MEIQTPKLLNCLGTIKTFFEKQIQTLILILSMELMSVEVKPFYVRHSYTRWNTP